MKIFTTGFATGILFLLSAVIPAPAETFTNLHIFVNGSGDGTFPNGVTLNNGSLYGATAQGGSLSSGMVFILGTNGAGFTSLHDFAGAPSDGSSPNELLVAGDTIYGTTYVGGSNSSGTIFRMGTNGANYTVLRNFTNSPDPQFSLAGLVLGGSTLYGVSASGGSSNAGAVFSLGTNGAGFALLHSFTNNEGLSPQSTLALNNGKLYGATLSRGTGGNGTVFQLSTNGANFTVLKNFTNLLTGANPKGPITLDANTIFGVANAGGPSSGGTVFRLQLAPVITAPPQDLAVTNGNPASFIVNAVSDSAMTYQWYFNASSPLAGQTGSSLNLASVSGIDAGAYTVVVSDFTGSVTSSPASLTVFSPPNITAQPQSLTVTNGNPATFNVTATNGVLSYQWYFNTNNLLVGQTNNSLNIAVTTTNDAGKYSVVVANNIGSTTSSPASLTVVASQPPSITAQPQNLSITNGDTAVFTVAAINGTLTYQWYFNTNSLLAGQTNNSLSIVVATTNNAGTYSVVVANNIGSITSSPARLTVSTNSRPFIITPPPNLYVTNGDTAKFSAVVTGKGPLAYQWYSNTVNTAIGTPLAGKTNLTLTLTSIATNSNARYFSIVITNSLGKATSSPALLTVITAPLIISNPQPATVIAGSPVNFSVTALGVGLGYQWYSNSVNTAIGTLLTGQTGTSYTFTGGTNHNGRYYSVVITNSFGKATSSPALLTVSSLPYFTLQPFDAIFTNGSSVTFTSAAAGPGPLAYQWLYQTNQPVAGATNTSLVITNGNFPGAYSMKVTNNFGAVTSSVAFLTISPLPYITLQPVNLVFT